MSERKRHSILRFVGYITLFLLIAYPLSIGPVFALQAKVGMFGGFFDFLGFVDSFYAPLMYLGQKSNLAADLIRDYVKLWL